MRISRCLSVCMGGGGGGVEGGRKEGRRKEERWGRDGGGDERMSVRAGKRKNKKKKEKKERKGKERKISQCRLAALAVHAASSSSSPCKRTSGCNRAARGWNDTTVDMHSDPRCDWRHKQVVAPRGGGGGRRLRAAGAAAVRVIAKGWMRARAVADCVDDASRLVTLRWAPVSLRSQLLLPPSSAVLPARPVRRVDT